MSPHDCRMDSQRRGKGMGESSTPAGSINGSDSTKLEWSPRSQLNGVRPVQYTSPHYLGKFARDPYMGSNKIIDFFSRTTQRVASEKSLRNQATGHVGHCVAEKRGGVDNWLLRKPIITPSDPFPRNSSKYWVILAGIKWSRSVTESQKGHCGPLYSVWPGYLSQLCGFEEMHLLTKCAFEFGESSLGTKQGLGDEKWTGTHICTYAEGNEEDIVEGRVFLCRLE